MRLAVNLALFSSTSFIVISYVLNILYRQPLFYQGLRFIQRIQRRDSSRLTIVLQNVFSLLGQTNFKIGIVFLVLVVSRNKIRAFVFFLFFILQSYLNTLSKLYFLDPRPFWATNLIQQLQWKCPGQFGNPSGHSRSLSFLYYLLIFDIIGRKEFGWLPISLLLTAHVALSRMYLGAHSLNQVVFGVLLGLCYLVMYRYGLKHKMIQGLNSLIRNKDRRHLLWILSVYLLTLLLPVIVYHKALEANIPTQYLANLLKSCPHTKRNTVYSIINGNFLTCALTSLFFGIVLSVSLGRRSDYRYLYGRWIYNPYRNQLLMLFYHILIQTLPSGICYFISIALMGISRDTHIRYVLLNIGLFLTTFMSVLTRPLLLHFHIIVEQPIIK